MSATDFLVELVNNKPVFGALALVTHHVLHSAEWDLMAHVILGYWTAFFGACTAAEYMYDRRVKSLGQAIGYTSVSAAIYFGTLIASTLIHRGFFHRLGKVITYHQILSQILS